MKYLLLLLALLGAAVQFQANAQVANTPVTLLASAAQTTTPVNSSDQTNFGYRGGHFIINVTSYTSGTYTPHIQAKDPISGTYYDVLVGPAIAATGITILKVYPGAGVLANASASDLLPLTWRVQMVGATVPVMTFSVSAFLEL